MIRAFGEGDLDELLDVWYRASLIAHSFLSQEFLDPDYQGRGIGRSLMDRARESRPFLELNVFEANAVGRRFYDAYGFEFVDRHIHEGSGQPELRLRLG